MQKMLNIQLSTPNFSYYITGQVRRAYPKNNSYCGGRFWPGPFGETKTDVLRRKNPLDTAEDDPISLKES